MTKAYEGTVVEGRIHLEGNIRLPENARVYVVVPDPLDSTSARIRTPRLAHPEQAREFQMEVYDEVRDGDV